MQSYIGPGLQLKTPNKYVYFNNYTTIRDASNNFGLVLIHHFSRTFRGAQRIIVLAPDTLTVTSPGTAIGSGLTDRLLIIAGSDGGPQFSHAKLWT